MDRKIFICLVISCSLITIAANLCSIKDVGQCYFAVNCDEPERIKKIPPCVQDPYVTLIVSNSTSRNITSNFFKMSYINWIYILNAAENEWIDIQDQAFSNLKNVLYIDLSQNNIKYLGAAFEALNKLDYLNLSRNNLDIINPVVFNISFHSRLYLLDLSYNNLTYIQNNLFENLHNLKILHLQGNKLTQLQEDLTIHFVKLNYLDVCCNNLKIINLTMTHFKYLRELNLSFNRIQHFNVSGLRYLEIINLNHNDIEEFMFEYFEQCPRIQIVDLSHNKLKDIKYSYSYQKSNLDVNNFVGLENRPLKKVFLGNNSISNIDTRFFHTFRYLLSLDLSFNKIKKLPTGTFKNSKILRFLNLSHCELKLEEKTFKGLKSLLYIDVSSNNITVLDAAYFKGCKQLIKIKADDNLISSINLDEFKRKLPKLSRITLLRNPYDEFTSVKLINRILNFLILVGYIIALIFILFLIILFCLYAKIHRRMILVWSLKIGRCLLFRGRLLR